MSDDPKIAWQPYEPTADNPWDAKKVGHLYRRAGFGANFAELKQGVADGPAKTIDRILAGSPADADYETSSEFMASERSLPAGAAKTQLAAWWLYRMLRTPHPLREKLTLFWHNHFATSISKVQNARYMLGQYRILNTHAMGSFRKMLHEITLDPAMMIWLDTKDSKRAQPNENYARELMELFSLGIGHYTEKDIREAAKAFTGYTLKGYTAHFSEKDHDASIKTVFKKNGKFQAKDIVDICLDQPACAEFIVGKLYTFFFSDEASPSKELLAPLVVEYRKNNYDTSKLVERMLRSRQFFSIDVYRTKVKSPIEFAAGIVRSLEGNVGPLNLATALETLGQVLFAPPSVKGWDGGATWLNGQTLLFRQNLSLALTSTEDSRFGKRCDPVSVLSRHDRKTVEEAVEFYIQLFFQNDVSVDAREQLAKYVQQSKSTKYPPYWSADDIANHRRRTLAHLTLTLPEFQLN